MKKNKNKLNIQKKPAMALVLIIIIITSVTAVIMGTVKIITSTSGKYSVNRNAKGVNKNGNPLGKYICFKYNNKLHEAYVIYRPDGSIMEGYPKLIEKKSGPCEFSIPEGISRFNYTLVGGGAAGAYQSYSHIDYLLQYRNKKIKKSDVYDACTKGDLSLDVNNQSYWSVLNGNPEIILSSTDNENFKKFLTNKIICKYNENNKYVCDFKNTFNEYNEDGSKNIHYKPEYENFVNQMNENNPLIPGFLTLNMIYNFGGNNIFITDTFQKHDYNISNINNIDKPLCDVIKSKYADAHNVNRICPYAAYLVYNSYLPAEPGNVLTGSFSRSDLVTNADSKELLTNLKFYDSYNSCANNRAKCNGYIGDGGYYKKDGATYSTSPELPSQTGFILNKTDIKTASITQKQIEPKKQRQKLSNYNEYSLVNTAGREAQYFLSVDFKLDEKLKALLNVSSGQNLLNVGSYAQDSLGLIVPKSATLFGSSGPILKPIGVPGGEDTSKLLKIIDNTDNCPSQLPDTIESGANRDNYGNLSGAPGAIIIEW